MRRAALDHAFVHASLKSGMSWGSLDTGGGERGSVAGNMPVQGSEHARKTTDRKHED